jgi:hypothetical protein
VLCYHFFAQLSHAASKFLLELLGFIWLILPRLEYLSLSLLNSGYLFTARKIDTSSKIMAKIRIFFVPKMAGAKAKSTART